MKHLLATSAIALFATATTAMANEQCHVAWSHYVGWEPAHLIQETGIADSWGQKMGVDLEFVFINDYIETINQYSTGDYQGVTATTIDTLTIPAVGGIDSTVLVIGDYSNGNDALLVVDPSGAINSVEDLAGSTINLVEYSISDYLLQRALEDAGMSLDDVTLENTSDADIGAVFATGGEGTTVVTWNPIVMTALATVEGAKSIYDSSKTPGEILDAIVVHTDTSDACKTAITGAWYEALALMTSETPEGEQAVEMMADFASGGTMGSDSVAWFNAQLATTQLFADPADGLAVAMSDELKADTQRVYDFALDRELLTAPVGIEFPDGTVIGDPENVKLHFDASYMEAATQ